MTVKQVIQKLQAMPASAIVVFFDTLGAGRWNEVTSVAECTLFQVPEEQSTFLDENTGGQKTICACLAFFDD